MALILEAAVVEGKRNNIAKAIARAKTVETVEETSETEKIKELEKTNIEQSF